MQKPLYILLAGAIFIAAFGMKKNTEHQPRINHIALAVSDLSKSTAFYRDIVSLDTIPEPFKDGKHTWFSIGDQSQLHLIEVPLDPEPKNKNTHLCFSVRDIDAFIHTLNQHRIEWSNWPGEAKKITIRTDGVKQIYFQDPDGNWLEINNDGR